MENPDISFGEWLSKELEKRQWNPAQLAKMIGKSRSVVGRIIGEKNKKQDPNTCIAIAWALGLSPVTVFRKAKILPPEPTNTVALDDLQEAIASLTPAGQYEVLEIALSVAKVKQNLEKGNQAAGSH